MQLKTLYKEPNVWLGTVAAIGVVLFAVGLGLQPKERQLKGRLQSSRGTSWVIVDSTGRISSPFTSKDPDLAAKANQQVTLWVNEGTGTGSTMTPKHRITSLVLWVLGLVMMLVAAGVVFQRATTR